MSIQIASIWAQDQRGVLGSGTEMLWHVPADFAHFKQTTLGSPIVMGRGSWEALGARALPGRTNIVITSRSDYEAPGAVVVRSLEEALSHGHDQALKDGSPTVWIAGGSRVYRESMEFADVLLVTDLDLVAPTDGIHVVYAPPIDTQVWTVDSDNSDQGWRPRSGDARWKVTTWVRRSKHS